MVTLRHNAVTCKMNRPLLTAFSCLARYSIFEENPGIKSPFYTSLALGSIDRDTDRPPCEKSKLSIPRPVFLEGKGEQNRQSLALR